MISYENAIRLKQSGFPQPDPEVGQFWYDSGDSKRYLITEVFGDSFCADTGLYDSRFFKTKDFVEFTYLPTALEILRWMDTYVTDGLNIFRINAVNEIEASVYIDLSLDDAASMCWLEQEGVIEPREVKYLTVKVNCPNFGTVDGAELECGDQHLWIWGEGEENGVYAVGVDPALSGESQSTAMIRHPDGIVEYIGPQGFAGTYTPLPEDK